MNLLKSRFFIPFLAILLIGSGLFFTSRFTRDAFGSYRAVQFAVENDFDAGNLDVDLVQPWMHLRYIADAYAIPQSYLFEQLDIPPDKARRRLPIEHINRRQRLGEIDGEPAIVGRVKEAIEAYRANPVVTGLTEGKVEPWMNMQYIANSTGILVETFFNALEIPIEGNAFKPLRWLVKSIEYEPGERHLILIVQEVVESSSGFGPDSRPDSKPNSESDSKPKKDKK
ncbi:MAG: hypothetical protein AAF702_02265 [Chloroflexota bacterium]